MEAREQQQAPLPRDLIHAMADAIVDEMTKHPSWSPATRARWAAQNYKPFLDTYPRLADACLNVRTFTDARSVRDMLDMMLGEMRGLEAGSQTFDAASASVGRALGQKYMGRFMPPSPSQ